MAFIVGKGIKMNFKNSSLQGKVFEVLKDNQFHCRYHEYNDIPTSQIAGGGGIQGLQRGTRKREGLEIESKREFCSTCQRKTIWDRWTGNQKTPVVAAHIPERLQIKVLEYYNYTDVIDKRVRPRHELVIDHRLPMSRWGKSEEKLSPDMTNEEINAKFQLFKKSNLEGNDNSLKSRACENCIKTGKRGYPMDIKYFYLGDENWPQDCPIEGKDAEKGCIGCGWYNFSKWREELNKEISSKKEKPNFNISEPNKSVNSST